MTIKSKHLLIGLAVAFTITVVVITSPRQSVAASVEDVAMMKSADRQKILIEGAKKEGKLMWYTTLIVDQVVRPVKEAFEKEYPFIQVEFYRGNAENLEQSFAHREPPTCDLLERPLATCGTSREAYPPPQPSA